MKFQPPPTSRLLSKTRSFRVAKSVLSYLVKETIKRSHFTTIKCSHFKIIKRSYSKTVNKLIDKTLSNCLLQKFGENPK